MSVSKFVGNKKKYCFILLVEENIPEHGEKEKELRREKKKKNGYWYFLYMGKKNNKWAPSIMKLRILGFLSGCFTDE